jgi:hypothetical protein
VQQKKRQYLKFDIAEQTKVDDQLVIETQNTFYHMTVLDPSNRKVRLAGGSYWPQATEVEIFTRDLQKGLSMVVLESTQKKVVTTSPIVGIEYLPA